MAVSAWRRLLNTTQIRNDYSHKPAGLRWRSNTIFILATVGVGIFTDLFLYSLVVPVLPFLLEDRVGIPPDQVQRYTSALLATLAASSVAFSPIAGVVADSVSTRQAPFLIGLSALIGATVLLFTSTTLPLLILARVLQGASSALVWTVGMALCIETVGPDNLGKTIGTLFSFISVGSLWAPAVGGILYEKTGVNGVLGIALAVLGVDFFMRLLVIEKKVAKRYEAEAESDNETSTPPTETPADNQTPEDSSTNERQPLLKPQEEDLTAYILPKQTHWLLRTVKILPCMRNPSLLVALLLALIQAITIGSIDATVATRSHELFGFSSLRAGVMFLPIGIMDLIVGPIAGWATDRYGTKIVATLSFALLAPIFAMLRFPHAGGVEQIVFYAGLLGCVGAALAGVGSSSVVEPGIVIDKYYKANREFFGENGPYAQLYGMNSAMFNIGLTVGPELAGELKEAIGYGNMNLVMAGLCAGTAVLSFVYIGGPPKVSSRRKT